VGRTQRTASRRFAVVVVATALALSGCAGPGGSTAPATSAPLRPKAQPTPTTVTTVAPTTTTVAPTTTTVAPTTTTTTSQPPPPPAGASSVGAFIAPLAIDDRPAAGYPYERADWPHWDDTDGDGCDGRNQALAAASITPPQIFYPGCDVVAGDWFSAYDGFTTSDPGDLDVDHVVSLAEAHLAGGWSWSTARKRQFANDQWNLWVVSASANRSKGSMGPDQWRPPRREVWCDVAIRWVVVKVTWGLTATTSERDALAGMLEQCASLPPPLR
jgi:hypothetical protein